jgi:hypothetical protein
MKLVFLTYLGFNCPSCDIWMEDYLSYKNDLKHLKNLYVCYKKFNSRQDMIEYEKIDPVFRTAKTTPYSVLILYSDDNHPIEYKRLNYSYDKTLEVIEDFYKLYM